MACTIFIFIAVCYMILPVRPLDTSNNNYKVAATPHGANKEAGTPPGAKQSSIDENHGV